LELPVLLVVVFWLRVVVASLVNVAAEEQPSGAIKAQ